MVKINLNYLTPQEHELFGSTVGNYSSRPYTPLSVQDGMDVDECNLVRKEVGKILITSGVSWGVNYLDCSMSLEDLSETGDTVRDPALVEFGEYCDYLKEIDGKFPYARELRPRIELK